jgi:hypothetical protein
MRWGGIKNGAWLTLIEREGFQVFLTGDKNMENQQQLAGRPFAVLVMEFQNEGGYHRAENGCMSAFRCPALERRREPGYGSQGSLLSKHLLQPETILQGD